MANIHTLGDYQRSSSNPARATTVSIPVDAQGTTARPRNSCVELFLPGFRWRSFIVIISILQILVFMTSLVMGSFALAPNVSSLNKLGASYGPAIQEGQVWRLITPIMLHANVWHILFNVFFQIRMGLVLETLYGVKPIIALYFISGLCGNLLSVAMAPCKSAVGASTAVFGLIGLQMSEMALTWHLRQNKDQAIFNIALFLLMTIMISIGPHSLVDWRGHLGGFLGGFALGVIYNGDMLALPTWYKTSRMVSWATFAALVVACSAVIFAIPMSVRGC